MKAHAVEFRKLDQQKPPLLFVNQFFPMNRSISDKINWKLRKGIKAKHGINISTL